MFALVIEYCDLDVCLQAMSFSENLTMCSFTNGYFHPVQLWVFLLVDQIINGNHISFLPEVYYLIDTGGRLSPAD